jgi:hypothetical protein
VERLSLPRRKREQRVRATGPAPWEVRTYASIMTHDAAVDSMFP